MYDNLTADDIIDVWSQVHLDHAVRPGREHMFHVDVQLALWLASQRKAPFRLISSY